MSEGSNGFDVAVVGATGWSARPCFRFWKSGTSRSGTCIRWRATGRRAPASGSGQALRRGRSRRLRFRECADRPVLRRRIGVCPSRAPRGRRGLRRDRQQLAVPLRQRRTARRARGESGSDFGLPQSKHHRESELLHDSARRRPAADSRRGGDRANQRRDLSVRLGTGRGAIEELAAQTAAVLDGRPAETGVYPKQIAFNALRTSTSSWTTAIPGKR